MITKHLPSTMLTTSTAVLIDNNKNKRHHTMTTKTVRLKLEIHEIHNMRNPHT